MEISFIRHGKSKHVDNKRITCKEFKWWVEKYDYSSVFEQKTYPLETIKKIASAQVVVTSNLKRSIESAKLLDSNMELISKPAFDEIKLPQPAINIQILRLKPNTWAVILRSLWFMGYSHGCESLSKEKSRAKIAADILIKYAQEHTSVVLVGHGFFNRLIAKELKRRNWKSDKKINSEHWNCTTYSFSE